MQAHEVDQSAERIGHTVKALVTYRGHVLVLHKGVDEQGNPYFDVPGGRVQDIEVTGPDGIYFEAESPIAALLRELEEELGPGYRLSADQLSEIRTIEDPVSGRAYSLYEVALEDTVSPDGTAVTPPPIVLSSEHTGYEWVRPSALAELQVSPEDPQEIAQVLGALAISQLTGVE